MDGIGAVVIGRNEGERLVRCLDSVLAQTSRVVYVDSASTDGSPERARERGAEVVVLDPAVGFTAARARNAGAERLLAVWPELDAIQFVDGDCCLDPDWLETAGARLRTDPQLAVVCGRRRERAPEVSIYNRLCDIEWNTPVGEAAACGGDALMRTAAFRQVDGFNPDIIAGEEPDLCLRLRREGWRIERLDAEMTLHDAAMTRFAQWWKRARRAGHSYAEGYARHGGPPDRHKAREVRSALVWGGVLPVVCVALAPATGGASLFGIGALAIVALRVRGHMRARGFSSRDATWYGAACALAKLPECLGVAEFHWRRLTGRKARIIEYKGAP